MAKYDRITKLSNTIKRRENESTSALVQLDRFCRLFYRAIEEALSALVFKGVESVDSAKRKKTSHGRESLYFTWNGSQFVCMPFQGVALPPSEQAELLGELAPKRASRLVMFAYPMGEPESSIAVCDHYVFPDRSWCASGLEHSARDNLNDKAISRYTLRLLDKLENQLALIWRSRHEVRFDETSRPSYRLVKHPMLYNG
jgi:hypothetical protein